MYIWERRGLGDNPATERKRITLAMRPRPYLKLDRFVYNRASLTPRLKAMVGSLVKAVELSWKSTQPIKVIRLIGHTDSTGPEKYNVGLGNRRARAVEEALQDIFKGRITITVEPSPGETEPTADNRTNDGRERNRRVEVFITTGVVSTPPPPPAPRKPLVNLWDFSKLKLPEESVIITKPGTYSGQIPPGPKPQSLEARLDELLSGISSRWLRGKIKDAILSGACALLEAWFTQAGGQLSEKQKEELRKRCLEAAKKPIR
jgi:OmpA family protein